MCPPDPAVRAGRRRGPLIMKSPRTRVRLTLPRGPLRRGRTGAPVATFLALLGLLQASCGREAPGERPVEAATAPGPGRWRHLPAPPPGSPGGAALSEEIERLQTLGYVQGSQLAGAGLGVTRYDPDRSEAGLNLCTSAHESGAFLMDMGGRTLHRWAVEFQDVWPDVEVKPDQPSRQCWRRVRLLPNGDLLAIWDGAGLVKVDRDSRVLWKQWNGAHHDLDLGPDGDIYVIAREAHIMRRVNPRGPVVEDFVLVLDREGREKSRVSLIEAFERSERYRRIWDERVTRDADVLHTNTIELLDGRLADRLPAFARGNVLVSMRSLDAIAVVDLAERRVVWAAKGEWKAQHEPTVLEDGHLLLFDNAGRRGSSAVLELEPVTMSTVWEYRGTDAAPFFSSTCGTAQRLAGGNTLITESDSGRAFETTPGKEIVWEYLSPHRAGPGDRLVATLFEVHRLSTGFVRSWLDPKVVGPEPGDRTAVPPRP